MELNLDHFDKIHVCTVMPATIDTPLFQHAANYSGRAVKAMDPVHRPDEVARVIMGLIQRPRREVIVGKDGKMMAWERRMAPGLFERLFARFVDRQHLQSRPSGPSNGNLYASQPEFDGVSGGWEQSSSERRMNRRARLGLAAGATVALAAGAAWMLTTHKRRLAHQKA
jgi:hypothetical protein